MIKTVSQLIQFFFLLIDLFLLKITTKNDKLKAIFLQKNL